MATAANAQTITDDLRREQKDKGKVVVNQSSDIEKLVNNQQSTPAVTKQAQEQDHNTTPAGAASATPNAPVATTPATTPESHAERPAAPERKPIVVNSDAEAENATVNTTKKVMRRSYKTTGYRIQVYSGGNKREDRTKCEQIAQRLKAKFPNLPIYVHFYSPSWKCRAGNFTDVNEAHSILSQVKAMGYSQACLVKGKINVQY